MSLNKQQPDNTTSKVCAVAKSGFTVWPGSVIMLAYLWFYF